MAYKERKRAAGIYAVRCAGSGEIWVGQSRSLDAVRNRLWFMLRLGTGPCTALQAAWQRFGADSFTVESVERLPEDTPAYAEAKLLKERLGYWRERLGAAEITDPPPSAGSVHRDGGRPT